MISVAGGDAGLDRLAGPGSVGRGADEERGLTALKIRDAVGADCDAIADIYYEAMKSGRSTMDTERRQPCYFEKLIGRCGEALLVAEVARSVIGWSIVKRYSDRYGYRFACETSIYISESCQDGGLGTKLFAATMDRARKLGYRHVVAKVLATNDSSIRFHERFGYETVGRQRAIGYLNGAWQDVVIMQLVFDDVAIGESGSEVVQ